MSKTISPTWTRRGFTLSALAGIGVTAGCANGVGSSGASKIEARVDATLNEMYTRYPNTIEIAEKSNGMLVMPLVTEAGFVFGGSYGEGALRVGGVTVDYYSVASASWGFQAGAQQFAHVLFFMTDDALADFRAGSGWTAGGDIGYVVTDKGSSVAAGTNTLGKPVIAAVFGQAGLFAGAALEGTKYTRVIR